jgi:hypothetical protein
MLILAANLRLANAVSAVMHGDSVRHAALQAEVDRCALRRRLEGVPTREETNESFQVLSKVQEDWLSKWAIKQNEMGHPPRLSYFKVFAQKILYNNGIARKLGKGWYSRFLSRHSEIKSLRARLVDYRRVSAASSDNIDIFFNRLELPEIQKILHQHIWNANEVGLIMGIRDNGIVIGNAYRKFLVSKDGENREWVSIIECISKTDALLPPLVIFAGKYVQQQWFPNDNETPFSNWYFETSSKG